MIADELHVNTIAVDAAHAGAGLGRALMVHVLADVALRRGAPRDAGGAAIEPGGPAAVRAARIRGQRACGTRYYTQPEEDALILWRETDAVERATDGAPRRLPRP